MKLIYKLFAGIFAGIVLGLFSPEWLLRCILTFSQVFGQLLTFIIPLFIFCFIAEGIANLEHEAGKMLGVTTASAYLSTLGAGLFACFVALTVIPHFELMASFEPMHRSPPPTMGSLQLPPIMSITTALIMAFIWGLGVAKTKATHLHGLLKESKRIIEKLVYHVLIPALPFYIASLFTEMTVAGEVVQTIEIFGMIMLLAISMHITWLLILFLASGLITRTNGLKALITMLPAYFTALGTMSSIATLPITLQQTLKNGVDEDIADFTVPLCATLHMPGSTITITTAAIAVHMLLFGTLPTWGALIPFVAMLGVMMIASPGVPGGSVMAALGILASMLGFTEAGLGLMITLYVAQDSFGTACNVTGDGAIAVIVNKIINKAKRRSDFTIEVQTPLEAPEQPAIKNNNRQA